MNIQFANIEKSKILKRIAEIYSENPIKEISKRRITRQYIVRWETCRQLTQVIKLPRAVIGWKLFKTFNNYLSPKVFADQTQSYRIQIKYWTLQENICLAHFMYVIAYDEFYFTFRDREICREGYIRKLLLYITSHIIHYIMSNNHYMFFSPNNKGYVQGLILAVSRQFMYSFIFLSDIALPNRNFLVFSIIDRTFTRVFY